MELIQQFFDLVLHVDRHLNDLIQAFGPWIYALMFLVIFCETGLVVTPILPGDSLLFALGLFAARGALDVTLLLVLLTVAAILGDSLNYWIGSLVGPRIFRGETNRFINKAHLDRTHEFYEKYGGKTIILARFVPIVRTFAPFVAGMGRMTYRRFMAYNVVGGAVWIGVFIMLGYLFGDLPIVKRYFTLCLLGIVVISVLPAVFEIARERIKIRRMRGDTA